MAYQLRLTDYAHTCTTIDESELHFDESELHDYTLLHTVMSSTIDESELHFDESELHDYTLLHTVMSYVRTSTPDSTIDESTHS